MVHLNTPYTYYLEWTTGMKYYGVQYWKRCKPSDLWNPYKTSSKYVKNYILIYGDPIIIEVRKVFTGESRIINALAWEQRVLKRIGAKSRSDYLNKRDYKGINCYDPEV